MASIQGGAGSAGWSQAVEEEPKRKEQAKDPRPPRWLTVKGRMVTPCASKADAWDTEIFPFALFLWTQGFGEEEELGKPEGTGRGISGAWGMVISIAK